MNTYRLIGFKSIDDKLLAKRYTDYKASKRPASNRHYKLKARYSLDHELLYMELYKSGATALYELVDVRRDIVTRYYRGKPVDRTRLSYMIGEYHRSISLKEDYENSCSM